MNTFSAFLLLVGAFFMTACSPVATAPTGMNGKSAAHERRSEDAVASDHSIRAAIAKELAADENWAIACHIVISVFNGVVLVTGETPTEDYRARLISAIRTIPGVKLLHDNLVIDYPSDFEARAEDTLINEKIKSAVRHIKSLPKFDASLIRVITERKTVYLMGLVRKAEGKAVIEAARHQPGVEEVVTIFEYID